jgi:hypothetical protein
VLKEVVLHNYKLYFGQKSLPELLTTVMLKYENKNFGNACKPIQVVHLKQKLWSCICLGFSRESWV